MQNWRPVSILNTDYKILTKALSNRLHGLLPRLINDDQVGYVKGGYIGQNVRIISHMLKYSDINIIPGYLLLLIDFEKAFDSIEWPFKLRCTKAYNFGECFIKWIKTIKIFNLVCQIMATCHHTSIQAEGYVKDAQYLHCYLF